MDNFSASYFVCECRIDWNSFKGFLSDSVIKPLDSFNQIDQKLKKYNISMDTSMQLTSCQANYRNKKLFGYRAELTLEWPVHISASGFACSKREAHRKVTDMMLTSFLKISLIDKDGNLLPEALHQFDFAHMKTFYDTLDLYSKSLNSSRDQSKAEASYLPTLKLIETSDKTLSPEKMPKKFLGTSIPMNAHLKGSPSMCAKAFHTSASAPSFTSTPNQTPVKRNKANIRSRTSAIQKENNNNSLESDNYEIEKEISNLSINDDKEAGKTGNDESMKSLRNVTNLNPAVPNEKSNLVVTFTNDKYSDQDASMKSLKSVNAIDLPNAEPQLTLTEEEELRRTVKENLVKMLIHLKKEKGNNDDDDVGPLKISHSKRGKLSAIIEESSPQADAVEVEETSRKRKTKIRKGIQKQLQIRNSTEQQQTGQSIEPEYNVVVEKEEKLNYDKLEKQFPEPKNKLHNIYTIVNNELKDKEYTVTITYQKPLSHKGQWSCTYKVMWPSEMTFNVTAKTKVLASKLVALKCLNWLQVNGKLKNGFPVIYDANEVNLVLKKPVHIDVQQDMLEDVKVLLDWYDREIKELLDGTNEGKNKNLNDTIDLTESQEDISPEGSAGPVDKMELLTGEPLDPIRGRPLTTYNSASLTRRNNEMYNRLTRRNPSQIQTKLPIMDYRNKIIKELEENRVLLIKGEPGCGKSTQVPQFIMDHFTEKHQATECNIVVTQPRRISAISLAERVAYERNEELGEAIGFQVRLKNVIPRGPTGGVLFCSTGILLRRLQNNPGLKGCSHVILDEAHERDINTDVLIVLLNRALQLNRDLRLVVMSATINASLFQKYFDCNAIHVPGFTYPVKTHFLNDIMNLGISGIKPQNMSLPNPIVNVEQMGRLVNWISRNKPEGAIMCFLPGWAEIKKLRQLLEENLSSSSHMILPVHSRLPHSEQRRIFSRPPKGIRKIILATNIAETSITVDDVVYVVDSAAHKEERLQVDRGLSAIDNQWVSQANVNQRKGRAGRVRPGESYHFVTKEKFDSLEEFPVPEVLRVPLEKTVLDCKTYSNEKAEDFLAQMPQPPRTPAVQQAVAGLIELGALDVDENLTALGRRIALFTVHPKLSKAMVYSTIFNCVCPMVTLTSVLSSESEIFADGFLDKSAIRDVKRRYQPASDHVAVAWLYQAWSAFYKESYRDAESFCRQSRLQPDKMLLLQKLRDLYAQHLTQCHMLDVSDDYNDLNAPINSHAGHDELVRGVLLAGMDQLLQRRDWDLVKGRLKKNTNVMLTEEGHRATITPESVNHKRDTWPSPYLTYLRQTHSMERRTTLIRETSLVSPLTVILFCQGRIEGYKYAGEEAEEPKILLTIKGKKNVKILCDEKLAHLLLKFRDTMWSITRYLVENQGLIYDDDTMEIVKSYKKQMLNVLGKMLHRAGNTIDYPQQVVRNKK